MELTGEQHIYGYLHQNFAWVLWAGARYLSESITLGTPTPPPWLGKDTEEGFTMVQLDKEDFLLKQLGKLSTKDGNKDISTEALISSRQVREETGNDFPLVCYCVLTGVQIYLKSENMLKSEQYIRVFKSLLPESLHRFIARGHEDLTSVEYRITSLASHHTWPNRSNSMCIEFIDDNQIKIQTNQINLPSRLPSLTSKIIKAVDEPAFTESVLEKRIKVLVEEWKNKVQCLQKMRQNQDTTKLKKVLGLQAHDQPLISYWISHLS